MFFLTAIKTLVSDHTNLMFWRLCRSVKELQIWDTDRHEHLNWMNSCEETHCWLFCHDRIHHDITNCQLNYHDMFMIMITWTWHDMNCHCLTAWCYLKTTSDLKIMKKISLKITSSNESENKSFWNQIVFQNTIEKNLWCIYVFWTLIRITEITCLSI